MSVLLRFQSEEIKKMWTFAIFQSEEIKKMWTFSSPQSNNHYIHNHHINENDETIMPSKGRPDLKGQNYV